MEAKLTSRKIFQDQGIVVLNSDKSVSPDTINGRWDTCCETTNEDAIAQE